MTKPLAPDQMNYSSEEMEKIFDGLSAEKPDDEAFIILKVSKRELKHLRMLTGGHAAGPVNSPLYEKIRELQVKHNCV